MLRGCGRGWGGFVVGVGRLGNKGSATVVSGHDRWAIYDAITQRRIVCGVNMPQARADRSSPIVVIVPIGNKGVCIIESVRFGL